MIKHRCTGLLFALLCFLFSGSLSGQSAEQLLETEEYAAAAQAFSARGTRLDDLAAGEAWLDAEMYAEAREAFLRVIKSVTSPDSLSAVAQHKIGVAYYNNFEDSLAMEAYRKAVVMRDQVFSGPVVERAHSRMNLGQILLYFGQADSAATLIREAIDIYANAHPTDTVNWIRGLTSLTSLSADARDYQVGMDAARRATDLIGQLREVDPYDAFTTPYTVGSAYQVFGDLEAARRAANEARRVAEAAGDPLAQAQTLNLLGGISQEAGEDRQSLNFHLKALELSEGTDMDDLEIGATHFNISLQYKELGQYDLALKHQRLALPLLADHPLLHPRLYSIKGDVFLLQEEYSEAKKALNQGVGVLASAEGEELHYPEPSGLNPAQLEILADLLGDRALALTRLEETEAARQDYHLLFRVQDDLRGRVTSDASRNYLSKNLRKFFDRAISLEFQRYQVQPDEEIAWAAFALSERAKAYSLLTAVQRNRKTMPAREAALRARIARLERSSTPDSPGADRLAAARLELNRLLLRHASVTDQKIPVFDKSKLQGLLQSKEMTLVGFHIGDTTAFQFTVVPSGGIQWYSLENPTALPQEVKNWREALFASSYKRKSLRSVSEQEQLDQTFLSEGVELYRKLFPVGIDNGTRLCILPDGALNVLPFAALPVAPVAPPVNYGAVKYLLNESSLHYAYSARIWLELTERPDYDYERNVLAFAPEFKGHGAASTLMRSAGLRQGGRALEGLAPLVHNRPEVEEVAALIGRSEVFFAAGANRQNFIDHLGRAAILHLSTHGVVNLGSPELSFVAFSQLGDSLEYEEMLYYNDLSSLPIKAELAVLSACETSLGVYVPGETSLSLASAFTAAGARSTLTSLWQVDDAATKELIVRFYQELAGGADRGAALTLAQRAHQQNTEFAHPYYWSAMTLYGSAGPLKLEGKPYIFKLAPYLLLALLALAGLVFLFMRKR